MGSFRMGFGALVSGAVSVLHNHTAMPMVSVMTVCSISGLLILVAGQRVIHVKNEHTGVNSASEVAL